MISIQPILAISELSWGQILRMFWPVGVVAFVVSLAATPLCRRIAMAKGIVDRPDDFLKPHQRPIPYLGGVAVFAGWIVGIGTALLFTGIEMRVRTMLGVSVAGLAVMLMGLFDDMRVMRPTVKLLCNVAVAIWLVYFGLGDDLVQVAVRFILGPQGLGERWLELVYSVPIMVMIVVIACNAANLIDGLDGLCVGVLGIISVGFFILAVNLRMVSNLDAEVANVRIVLALSMLGAAAGFLPFNRNPAKIFLGDAGSMLLGLNAAILILLFAEENLVRWMIGSLMVFGLPLSDMVLTLVRRWRNGRPVMQGDRSHFYDQLRDRGLSVRRVVAISYLLTLAFVLVGVSVIFLRTRYAILVYALVVVAVVLAVWKLDMVSIERGSCSAQNPSPRPGRSADESEGPA